MTDTSHPFHHKYPQWLPYAIHISIYQELLYKDFVIASSLTPQLHASLYMVPSLGLIQRLKKREIVYEDMDMSDYLFYANIIGLRPIF